MRKKQKVTVEQPPRGCSNPGEVVAVNKETAVIKFNKKYSYVIPKSDLTTI